MFTPDPQWISLILCLAFVVGCGQSAPHNDHAKSPTNAIPDEHADPHDVPLTAAEIDKLQAETATWSDAVKHIQMYRDTIKTAASGAAPSKAHRPLDLLDNVLERLPEITQTSNVPKNDWQTIGESAETLRELFNRVHANIDDGKDPDYASVAAEIDAAVEALSAIQAGETPASDVPK